MSRSLPSKERALSAQEKAPDLGTTAPSAAPSSGRPESVSGLPPPRPQFQRRRLLVWTTLLLAGAMALVYAVLQRAEQAALGRTAVQTATVIRGDLQLTMTISGTISALQSAAIIAPRLERRQTGGGGSQMVLVSLPEPGSYVEKGAVIAEFERENQLLAIDEQTALVVQADAEIDKARAAQLIALEATKQAVRTAKGAWEKAKLDLRTAEVRSEIEAEKLKLAVEEGEAEHKQAQEELALTEIARQAQIRSLEIRRDKTKAALRRAENNAQGMLMRSPIDGLVVMMPIFQRGSGDVNQVRTGDEVFPGTYFMQIVDTSAMILSGTINQVDSQYFRVGQQAEIQLDAYPDTVLSGRLTSLGALATSGSAGGFSRGGRTDYVKRIPVTFSIDANDPRVIPDLSARAHVVLQTKEDVVLAPREGIWEEAGRFFAHVQQSAGAVFTRREVETGSHNNTQVAIVAGLEPGDHIALRGPAAR